MHRSIIVAGVKQAKIERPLGFRLPQPQQVCGLHPKAEHSGIVWRPLNGVLGYPAHMMSSLAVMVGFGVSAKLHVEPNLRTRGFPAVAETQPLLGYLKLPAVAYFLIEDAEFIADTIADRRYL